MQKGRANPSDYRIILPSKALQFAPDGREFSDYISFFCRAATLPSPSNTMMKLAGQENLGIARNVITGRNYGSPVVFTFTERSDLVVYSTLKGWIDQSVLNSEQTDNRNLRVNFYNNVRCDIEIHKVEPQLSDEGSRSEINPDWRGHRVTGIWKMINACPIAIEQATLAIESADSALDFSVSIAYESFTFEKVNGNPKGYF